MPPFEHLPPIGRAIPQGRSLQRPPLGRFTPNGEGFDQIHRQAGADSTGSWERRSPPPLKPLGLWRSLLPPPAARRSFADAGTLGGGTFPNSDNVAAADTAAPNLPGLSPFPTLQTKPVPTSEPEASPSFSPTLDTASPASPAAVEVPPATEVPAAEAPAAEPPSSSAQIVQAQIVQDQGLQRQEDRTAPTEASSTVVKESQQQAARSAGEFSAQVVSGQEYSEEAPQSIQRRSDPQSEGGLEQATQPTGEPEVQTAPEPEIPATPEPEIQAASESNSQATPEPEVRAAPEAESHASPEPQSQTNPDSKIQAAPELESQTAFEPEIQAAPHLGAEPAVETRAEPMSDAATSAAPELGIELAPKPAVQAAPERQSLQRREADAPVQAPPDLQTAESENFNTGEPPILRADDAPEVQPRRQSPTVPATPDQVTLRTDSPDAGPSQPNQETQARDRSPAPLVDIQPRLDAPQGANGAGDRPPPIPEPPAIQPSTSPPPGAELLDAPDIDEPAPESQAVPPTPLQPSESPASRREPEAPTVPATSEPSPPIQRRADSPAPEDASEVPSVPGQPAPSQPSPAEISTATPPAPSVAEWGDRPLPTVQRREDGNHGQTPTASAMPPAIAPQPTDGGGDTSDAATSDAATALTKEPADTTPSVQRQVQPQGPDTAPPAQRSTQLRGLDPAPPVQHSIQAQTRNPVQPAPFASPPPAEAKPTPASPLPSGLPAPESRDISIQFRLDASAVAPELPSLQWSGLDRGGLEPPLQKSPGLEPSIPDKPDIPSLQAKLEPTAAEPAAFQRLQPNQSDPPQAQNLLKVDTADIAARADSPPVAPPPPGLEISPQRQPDESSDAADRADATPETELPAVQRSLPSPPAPAVTPPAAPVEDPWGSLEELLQRTYPSLRSPTEASPEAPEAPASESWSDQFRLDELVDAPATERSPYPGPISEDLVSPLASAASPTAAAPVEQATAQATEAAQTITSPLAAADEVQAAAQLSDEESLEMLAYVVYGLLRQQWAIAQERYYALPAGVVPWFDGVCLPGVGGGRSAGDFPGGGTEILELAQIREIEELSRAVNLLIESRLGADLERWGKGCYVGVR
ncbi:MAG: hypothetical protein ACFB8W_21800 [Elainellaceae cyanobacterium]